MQKQLGYTIFPLGDSGLIVDFPPAIDEDINRQVLHLFHALQRLSLPEILDVIPAYSSVSIFYDVLSVKRKEGETAYDVIAKIVQELLLKKLETIEYQQRKVQIPVCYEPVYGPDLQEVAVYTNKTAEEIIALHTSEEYRVYMIGFLPGFAYMGEIDASLEMPRKATPTNVLAGSVGITGKQTGIYPLNSPGGWQIIGRTPWSMFDANAEKPVLLEPGDIVQFFSISEDEFENYKGRRS